MAEEDTGGAVGGEEDTSDHTMVAVEEEEGAGEGEGTTITRVRRNATSLRTTRASRSSILI